jgi:hypothetical protein
MGMAQIATVPKHMLKLAAQAEAKKPISDLSQFTMAVNPTVKAYQFLPEETTIGISWYDFFSNSLIGQHLTMFSDGTMNAAWTFGLQAADFPDRGTGYNYFDGNAWGPWPTERIEAVRTGWGHVSAWGTDGEFVVAHNGVNLTMNKRETKGSGDWTEMDYVGVAQPTWPKHAVSGEDNEYLHVVYHSYNEYEGMPGAMLYSRSMDGGETWDPADVILDGTGPDFYYEIQAEAFYITARGETVAILVGSPWNDMFIMKSTDNGDSWDKIMIWEHPYPFFDFESTITDTLFSTDNSGHVCIDADGMCHVVFGINRVLHDAVGATYSYFPWVDGIGYWNEEMDPFSNDLSALAPPQYGYATSEMIEDYNYIGYAQDVDGDGILSYITTSTGFPMSYRQIGPTSMPVIHVDDMGRRFLVFSSYTETYDNFEWNYHKIWARAYENGMWGPFYHVTQDIVPIFDESINPSIAEGSDAENIYFLYMADGTPGTALDGDHDYQENRFIVAALPKSDVLTGAGEQGIISEASVSQNYPNPFSDLTTITVNLKDNADLSMEVTSLTGQQVMIHDRGYVSAGTYYFQVDASDLATGIYFYRVKAGNSEVTRKMIVK